MPAYTTSSDKKKAERAKHIPAKTRMENEDIESEYESDGGSRYYPRQNVGKGAYAIARTLEPKPEKSENKTKKSQKMVVLAPCETVYFEEALRKCQFFQTLYPESNVKLFKNSTNYRLILPLVPGKSYEAVQLDLTPEKAIKLFLSTVEALKKCHSLNLIVIDLKSDNIFYDETTNTSYLIDGGLSTRKGDPIPEADFKQKNSRRVQECQKQFRQCAPECFYVDKAVMAAEAMDVYSLGDMMHSFHLREFFLRDSLKRAPLLGFLKPLYSQCKNFNSGDRPTLDEVEAALMALREVIAQEPVESTPLLTPAHSPKFFSFTRKDADSFPAAAAVDVEAFSPADGLSFLTPHGSPPSR